MPDESPAKDSANSAKESTESEQITVACCSDQVHIAYRGKADERLYIAYNRKWNELRYYQANGLKAFCAVCRHRVY